MGRFKKNRQVAPASGASYSIHVVGAPPPQWSDLYHALLRLSWTAVLALLAIGILVINAVFAVVYMWSGGIAHARPHAFSDAFNFSVQTFGTIGYGVMYPETDLANAVVLVEAIVSLAITALATGLVFAKFARPVGRVVFSRHAVIAPMDGVPTLAFRLGNERGNSIVEATAKVSLVRTIRTREGQAFYKMIDLKLTRERSPAVSRSWTVLHVIDGDSPLRGATPESLAREDAELLVSLAGTDDTSYQPVFARYTYEHPRVLWGARHADVLSETADGDLVLDVRRFHDVVPSEPTEEFPYPKTPSTAAGS